MKKSNEGAVKRFHFGNVTVELKDRTLDYKHPKFQRIAGFHWYRILKNGKMIQPWRIEQWGSNRAWAKAVAEGKLHEWHLKNKTGVNLENIKESMVPKSRKAK